MSDRIRKIRNILDGLTVGLDEAKKELQKACLHVKDQRTRGADSDGPYEFCQDCWKRME